MVGVQPLEGRMRAAALSLTSQGEALSITAMPMAAVSRAHMQQQPLRPHHIQAPGMLQVSCFSEHSVVPSWYPNLFWQCKRAQAKGFLWCAGAVAAGEQVYSVKSERVCVWIVGPACASPLHCSLCVDCIALAVFTCVARPV